MAVKSALGHAETGAGALGVFHVCQHLCSLETDALTHLRTLNPHVAGVLDSHSSRLCVALPRQSTAAAACCVGVSSFAFQVRLHGTAGRLVAHRLRHPLLSWCMTLLLQVLEPSL